VRRALDALHPGAWVPPVVAFGLVLIVWQLVAVHDHFVLPTLAEVAKTLVGHPGTFMANGGDTLAEALPGVAISYGAALFIAVAMDQSRVVSRAILPLAVALNVTPLIAIAPALGVSLGVGRSPRFVVTALITFFPVLINSIVGLRSADPQAVEVFKTLHASKAETLWRLQLPSSLPYLFAAARIVVPLSVVGAAIAEMVTSGPGIGLGFLIQQWSSNGQLNYAWAGIVTLAVFGLVLTGLVVLAEDRVLRWRGFR
jgi:NitT/TauT family transport system permease protein